MAGAELLLSNHNDMANIATVDGMWPSEYIIPLLIGYII
jgi:hypothetical protein